MAKGEFSCISLCHTDPKATFSCATKFIRNLLNHSFNFCVLLSFWSKVQWQLGWEIIFTEGHKLCLEFFLLYSNYACVWPCGVCDRQTPLSTGFSRQEDWMGCHALLQGIFLTQRLKLGLLHYRQIPCVLYGALAGRFFTNYHHLGSLYNY